MPTETDGRSDEELMRGYIRGDAGDFERLFRRHRRTLFTFLLHHVGDRGRAEDLFQEVFLRLIRGREGYAQEGSFRAWLYAIAHNAVTDDRRRRGVRDAVRLESDSEANPATGDGDDAVPQQTASRDRSGSPVAMSELGELRERVEEALLHLPEAQREVFLLRERAGLTFELIATTVGCPIPTVKSRMRYALENLRRRLSGELIPVEECSHE